MQVQNQIGLLYEYFTTVGCNEKRPDKLVTSDLELIPKSHWLIRCITKLLHRFFGFENVYKNAALPVVIETLSSSINAHSDFSEEVKNQGAFVLAVLKNIRDRQDVHLVTLMKLNQTRGHLANGNANIDEQERLIHIYTAIEKQYLSEQKSVVNLYTSAKNVHALMTEGQSPLANFPPEVLENIFVRCSANDVKSCALVCRNWLQSASHQAVWKKILGLASYSLLLNSWPGEFQPLRAFCAFQLMLKRNNYIKIVSATSESQINELRFKKITDGHGVSVSEKQLHNKERCVGRVGQLAMICSEKNHIALFDIQSQKRIATLDFSQVQNSIQRAHAYKGFFYVITEYAISIYNPLRGQLVTSKSIDEYNFVTCDDDGVQLVFDQPRLKREQREMMERNRNEVLRQIDAENKRKIAHLENTIRILDSEINNCSYDHSNCLSCQRKRDNIRAIEYELYELRRK